MVATAKVIDSCGADNGAVALFSKVTLLNEKLQKEQTIRIVTTLRQNALKGLISKESPVGRALLGRALLCRALLGGIGSGPLRARGARRRGKQLQEATPPLCTGDYEGLDGRARKMFRTPREKREGPPSEPSRKRAGVRPLSKAARRRARCHRA